MVRDPFPELLVGRRAGRDQWPWSRDLVRATEWAADDDLTLHELKLRAACGNLRLELRVRERDSRNQHDRHVVDRPVAEAAPVAGIDDVAVGRRVIEIANGV